MRVMKRLISMMTSTIALMKAIRSMRPVGGSRGVCVDDMIVLATQYICKFLLLDHMSV